VNQDIKAKWVSELRSGTRQQGGDFLRQHSQRNTTRYSPLGVLAEIALQDSSFMAGNGSAIIQGYEMSKRSYTTMAWKLTEMGQDFLYNLPPSIISWAGLDGIATPALQAMTAWGFDKVDFLEVALRIEQSL
jgi:hypothetical protein